jgi:hypothetical protein
VARKRIFGTTARDTQDIENNWDQRALPIKNCLDCSNCTKMPLDHSRYGSYDMYCKIGMLVIARNVTDYHSRISCKIPQWCPLPKYSEPFNEEKLSWP